ncbi:hypothetical protein B0G75_104271 [Paraburkholderia sp. BL18I3N2]|uniref:hypothetical protein n=1 Tax=Paraburkholderia sp. BL18I3N2 TaxID=1938799 RepID=UPI000D085E43|nr:hypothetical protein [Paraburkholderia sp. BL18I3N2]PRX32250.1 hypothetical protein B0G75_104271 [Paraburkholderia sp. BL18I3N2]
MADAFRIIPPQVIAAGTDVPPEQINAGFINMANQLNVALNTLANGGGPVFAAAMLAWFNSLPTALPATAGVLWNNGGTLAQS